jgi:benzoate membrane transport protein
MQGVIKNVRDIPSSTTLSALLQGFFVVLVGYTGPLLVVIQAGKAGGLSDPQISSWVWGVVVGNGVLGILMSLAFRVPLAAPYSTAGAALLGVSMMNFPFQEVVGAYVVVGLAVFLLGLSGLFGRLVALIPQPVAMGMLAGVLLRFGLDLFKGLPVSPLVITAMLVIFYVLKRIGFKVPMLGALILGVVVSLGLGEFQFQAVALDLTQPIFVMPTFSLSAILTLALPLFVVALSSQYIPGQAILKFYGYDNAPIDRILMLTGLGSALVAFVGAHGMTLSAYTAAFIVSPDAHPDKDKRYVAGVYAGLWHIVTGIFGATVVALFSAFPSALVAGISGLALLGTIQSSLHGALDNAESRDAALVAFLCTAANFSLFGVGAPFWGLLAGVAVYFILRWHKGASDVS